MKKFKFYSDASHGWLAVPRSLLMELGIAQKISAYSYQSKSGKTVYLEEDCDATLFLKEIRSFGFFGESHLNIVDIDHGNRSWIRSLKNYSLK